MVSLQPNDRPSAIETLGHTWITDPGSGASDEDSDEVAQIPAGEGIGGAEVGRLPVITSPNTIQSWITDLRSGASDEDSGEVAQIPADESIGGAEMGNLPIITSLGKMQSDLIEWYRIETELFQDYVRHTNVEKARSRYEKVKEVWHNDREIGRGGFGVVHKQIQRTTGLCRAVKTIDKRWLPPDHDYFRELLVMAILAKCPTFFVKLLGWFEGPTNLYIAMEYLEGGDLTKYIGKPLPQDTVRNISKQILEGLEVMHQEGMAHRNLKPGTIFVVSMSPVWVKLGGFVVSKRIQEGVTEFRTQAFAAAYAAPEVQGLDSNSETPTYTNSVDIWSFGCVVYELLVGTMLFPREGHVIRYFFGILPFPEDRLKGLSPPTDDVGISLLKSVLAIQPEDRPTAAGALDHEWLVGLE
ncbi:kinase-like domain-containing protein [Tuber brumale]|nr:kinase-like domain-containing protein [Tuber brumale]